MSLRPGLLSVACFFVLVASVTPARADTFSIFNIAGSLSDGGNFSGNITLDTTTNQISNSNFTAFTSVANFTYNTPPGVQGPFGPTYFVNFVAVTGGTLAGFNIYIPQTSLAGYAGGTLCSLNAPCPNPPFGSLRSGISYTSAPDLPDGSGPSVVTGSLSLASPAATPEPSSLLLLGTGVLGLAGAARRRFLTPIATWNYPEPLTGTI